MHVAGNLLCKWILKHPSQLFWGNKQCINTSLISKLLINWFIIKSYWLRFQSTASISLWSLPINSVTPTLSSLLDHFGNFLTTFFCLPSVICSSQPPAWSYNTLAHFTFLIKTCTNFHVVSLKAPTVPGVQGPCAVRPCWHLWPLPPACLLKRTAAVILVSLFLQKIEGLSAPGSLQCCCLLLEGTPFSEIALCFDLLSPCWQGLSILLDI